MKRRVRVEWGPGGLDYRLQTLEGPYFKAVFTDMQGKLRALLRKMGAAEEPNWTPPQILN